MEAHRSSTVLVAALLAPAALALAACEVGLGTGLHDDRLASGRYEGEFLLEWDPVGEPGGWEEDRGTLHIDRFGSRFSGDWRWLIDGRWLSGRLHDGRDQVGRITFFLETDFGEDVLEAVTGCRFHSGERRFRGRGDRGWLHAERSARLRCRDRFGRWRDVWFRLAFSGHRDRHWR